MPTHRPLSTLSPFQDAVLHSPCRTLFQTLLMRYQQRVGDVMGRLVVIRYAHLYDGAPLWHAAVLIDDGRGGTKRRDEWTRRDRRRAAEFAIKLLTGCGDDDREEVDEPGQLTTYALHRTKPLRAAEVAHLPSNYMHTAPVDLTTAIPAMAYSPEQIVQAEVEAQWRAEGREVPDLTRLPAMMQEAIAAGVSPEGLAEALDG